MPQNDHRPLDDKLDELRRLQEDMLQRVTEQLEEASLALLERDTERAAAVRASDDEIDALELHIDSLCERILALHTPVAVDLRLILTAVKINTDLERIGDHAKNIAESIVFLEEGKDIRHGGLEEEAAGFSGDLGGKIPPTSKLPGK